MRKKGNITTCMSSVETEDLDNDMEITGKYPQ